MNRHQHQVEQFDADRVYKGRLFGNHFEEDPWVIFHGTSASCSGDIETNGFQYPRNRLNASQVQQVTDVFHAMRWDGNHTGGYAVLKTFSMSDFSGSASSPIFFTEKSTRALRYAAIEHAGGEKLRAVRWAIADLRLYLRDEGAREEHATRMAEIFDYLVKKNAESAEIEFHRPPAVDLEWLDTQIGRLADLDRVARQPVEDFAGGIVYAVRMEPCDVETMEYDFAMGIKARSRVHPERIVGKMNIPVGYAHDDYAIKQDIDRLLRRLNSGVVAAIGQRAKPK